MILSIDYRSEDTGSNIPFNGIGFVRVHGGVPPGSQHLFANPVSVPCNCPYNKITDYKYNN